MADTSTFLAKSTLFSLLDEEERHALATRMCSQRLAAGENLFEQGESGEVLFLVQSGRIRLSLRNDVGETIVLAENSAGAIFGEISLFDRRPRTTSADALEDTELLTLKRDDLLAFLTLHPHAALDLLAVMAGRVRETDDLLCRSVARNPNEKHNEQMSLGERVADRVASFGGSWTFILLFGMALVVWMGINVLLLVDQPFDPYPFILLNLVLSTLAAIQAPVIMMSQNRQAAKDRLQADYDYEINRKAELEIAQLHRKVDRISGLLQTRTSEDRPIPVSRRSQDSSRIGTG